MNKQEFVVGMEILKSFYLDWSFCFSEMQISVWYEYFKKYDLNKFIEIIECYITEKSSGPDSPKDLISPYNWEHYDEWNQEYMSNPKNAELIDFMNRAFADGDPN